MKVDNDLTRYLVVTIFLCLGVITYFWSEPLGIWLIVSASVLLFKD